jgi:hypothetical protein
MVATMREWLADVDGVRHDGQICGAGLEACRRVGEQAARSVLSSAGEGVRAQSSPTDAR